jgi:NADPH:quinone reductase-like Zn-dependent oxidoreductase
VVIPLSDGAGIVERIGKGVSEFAVGDHVVSCFFPEWLNGEAISSGFATTPGDGRGVDHVIELGGPDTLPQSISACRIGGHIELIGVLTGFSGPIPTVALVTRQVRLQGLVVGNRQQQIEMIRALDANDMKPVIDKTFPLQDLIEAFRYKASGAHFGKICIEA